MSAEERSRGTGKWENEVNNLLIMKVRRNVFAYHCDINRLQSTPLKWQLTVSMALDLMADSKQPSWVREAERKISKYTHTHNTKFRFSSLSLLWAYLFSDNLFPFTFVHFFSCRFSPLLLNSTPTPLPTVVELLLFAEKFFWMFLHYTKLLHFFSIIRHFFFPFLLCALLRNISIYCEFNV